ncbi:hypothetical protein Achl_1168 [Pseudarthrobacter chlorophenolicus A6]|uniref:Uncharacterized protein n=1 Tax=Pseudarthrobacter chlorophenolicus (strain ATCC 700700 / DSM 12829 / CIP 107037 / JCM 12360 / KCTC 9906 / NCIMB 13794 / A6) TaxID=452863 RepID=B8HEP3_PSECP|nr:hypothetical protein [Pseudarthrobacter chlorophenolicus]ACL39159.1 hypothetical protein Achl_1168 [Pseudarthrobacter chlorophenolicus A6]SDR03464.1 hypothetical protein SAMN04489738_4359 [Pseudarthrobacter chlorophenolicus]
MPQSPSKEPREGVAHIEVTETHEEILEYWTDKRMAEAKPRELVLQPEPEEAPQPDARD